MKYCSECGTQLIEKECGIDGLVPYCPTCKQFRFPMFNSAISTIIFNPTKDKILLIKQYGKNFNDCSVSWSDSTGICSNAYS